MIFPIAWLLLTPGLVPTVPAADFSKERQRAAVAATVRIVNGSRKVEGSGVVIGQKGSRVYILTAQHLIVGAKRLEITTYSQNSPPKPQKVYHSGRVIAESSDMRDIALIRLITDDRMPGTALLCPPRLLPDANPFTALTVGFPEGKPPVCVVDEVVGKKRVRRPGIDRAASFWEVNRKHLEGGSGGPMIDRQGYLLGVCSGTNQEKTYYCHAEEIRAFLKESGVASPP
jgi:S1-C subfamily serine protease